ncbi:DUF3054 domain-containing protein [Bowdeniella nasicola]|uniref:DUF3054 domain-containing protein n=1 Tax=Bowdeniella nasicola TaxID=208480 RepID=UPI0009FA72F0|nr:DUF3054 domain-containing protein [Bowdeniella nasicola]
MESAESRPNEGPSPLGASSDPRQLIALAADTVAVFALALIGRWSHSEGLSFGEVFNTAVPFLAGAYLTHLLIVRYFDPTSVLKAGLSVWLGTWAVGMFGRLFMGQTNAVAFMAVSAGFLLATMLGWRLIYTLLRKRGANPRD